MAGLTYSPGLNPSLFTTTFPDTPPEEAQFATAHTNYTATNPSGNYDTLAYFNTSLESRISNLSTFQTSIISSIPEYNDTTTARTLLSSMSTVAVKADNLQGQSDVIDMNLANSQLKQTGGFSTIEFIIYTSSTIVLGILSICLIVYLVYLYQTPSTMVGGAITGIKGISRQKSLP